MSTAARELARLAETVIHCRLCPRLVRYREQVARDKKREFAHWTYWGRPVPGLGDPEAELLIVGLAPAAHGANRTGRMFTGDGSGQWLIRAMHRHGFASQPSSLHRDDGLTLPGAFITATVRCAPPDNKPLPSETENCARYLRRELEILERVRVVVALGHIGFTRFLLHARERGFEVPRPRPAFGHGVSFVLHHPSGGRLHVLASYHPSRQNTQTGRLTEPMLNTVFRRAREILDAPARG